MRKHQRSFYFVNEAQDILNHRFSYFKNELK